MDTDQTRFKHRIQKLRKEFAPYNVAGILVPRGDEWLGEFVAPYAERLAWLTGFTGSAGTALIFQDRALLFTDPRYTTQARTQCADDIFEVVDITITPIAEWIKGNCEAGIKIGFDPWLHTDHECQKLIQNNVQLIALDKNLIDQIWQDQPTKPKSAVYNFPDHVAGDTHIQKCNQVAWMIKEIGVRWYILTQPDSIAWLLNIRSHDVAYTPIALSTLMIGENGELIWFIDPERLHKDVRNKLQTQAKYVHPDNMPEMLKALRKAESDISFSIDFKRSPLWFKLHFAEMGKEIIDIKDPCLFPKSLKTRAEQRATRDTHIQDGVAVTRFLKWLDEEGITSGENTHHSEMSVADKLEEFRSLSPHYLGPSFPTISGFGANAAIIHYRAEDKTDTKINGNGLLLVDSGGQYHYGTTDITRTIRIGTPTKEMKQHFTLVLKGMIAVSNATFKDGTSGREIDALARAPLLDEGLNYAHGTGHGVGCMLAVHEHAANLSPRGDDPLKPGMLLSNEPGYYQEGSHGIRIENLILCTFQNADDAKEILDHPLNAKVLYAFETVTFAPIDRSLIQGDMLDDQDRQWLNDYHAKTYKKLAPLLSNDEQEWLKKATLYID